MRLFPPEGLGKSYSVNKNPKGRAINTLLSRVWSMENTAGATNEIGPTHSTLSWFCAFESLLCCEDLLIRVTGAFEGSKL